MFLARRALSCWQLHYLDLAVPKLSLVCAILVLFPSFELYKYWQGFPPCLESDNDKSFQVEVHPARMTMREESDLG